MGNGVLTDVMQKNGVLVDGESVTPSDTGEEDLHALLMWYVFIFLLSLLLANNVDRRGRGLPNAMGMDIDE